MTDEERQAACARISAAYSGTITPEEVPLLMAALGPDPHPQDVEAVLDWAHKERTGATLLQLVLEGKLRVEVERGGPQDGEMRFYATEAG